MNAKLCAAPTFALLFTACYGAAPGRPPRVPLPDLADAPDARVGVHSETRTQMENVAHQTRTCTDPPNQVCATSTTYVEEPVTRTKTTATLDSQPINYAQFKVITDPKWNAKLEEIDDLSKKCERANVPRYVGMGAMLGGLLVGSILGKAGATTAGEVVAYGGIGGGAGSYILGFFAFGGNKCVAARLLYDSMDLSRAMGWNEVEGADTAAEMQQLADQFNSSHGLRGSAQSPAPVEDIEIVPAVHVKPAPPVKTKAKKGKRTASLAMRTHP